MKNGRKKKDFGVRLGIIGFYTTPPGQQKAPLGGRDVAPQE